MVVCLQFIEKMSAKCLQKLGLQIDRQRIAALFSSPNPKFCTAFSPNQNLLGECLTNKKFDL